MIRNNAALAPTTLPMMAMILVAGTACLYAGDHLNLEDDMPVTIEDAYPTAYRGAEFIGRATWERTKQDNDRVMLEPELNIGVFPNAELEVSAPFYLGNADDRGSGNVHTSLLYNFNVEGVWIPAVALKGTLEIPSGEDAHGVDTTLKLILTKSIGDSMVPRRIHLNVAWQHNFQRQDDERSDRYIAAIGYSQPLGPDTLLVLDLVREQDLTENMEANFFEIGIRQQLTPRLIWVIGGGPGFGDESPDFRLTTGFQIAF